MIETFRCIQCNNPLVATDSYCAQCGRPSGCIRWTLSAARQPGVTPILLRSGESFYLVAQNVGLAQVRIELDTRHIRGARLQGMTTGYVEGRQSLAFELQHLTGEDLGGVLVARSRDALRREWWERASWRQEEFRLPGIVRVRDEKWILGSEAVVFPPGVRQQAARVWNDAERERVFYSEIPVGYRALHAAQAVTKTDLKVPAGQSLELILQALPRAQGNAAPDKEWRLGPDAKPIPVIRLESPPRPPGPDAVVAIDFGTRNTSVRVRWRRTLLATKPEGAVDIIGDKAGSARFPTEMVVHKKDRSFLWGTEAAAAIQANRLAEDEFAVDNLKTHLRVGVDAFTQHGAEWTNEALLVRYFEQIFARLDNYFRTADPSSPLTRASLNLRYVLTRPVLDMNAGDEIGKRYEQAQLRAMERCGVTADAITFALEPVTAAIGIARRREQELLGLEGQAIAVVDAGGGTTDVALATVRLRGGRIALDLTGSHALNLNQQNAAHIALKWFGMSDRVEVGGNVLDCVLAYQLMADAGSLLETDARPVPRNLDLAATSDAFAPVSSPALNRQRLAICRQMKERFARFSRQYLNRPKGTPLAEGESLPFPTRAELEGVYLEHALVDENLFGPILRPVVGELSDRMMQDAEARKEQEVVRPAEVKRAFYVGGTNIDAFVRQRFGRAFPNAQGDSDADAQSMERIAERLNAVVEGAVWYDEQLFAPAPLTLTVQTGDRTETLLTEGAALLPAGIAHPRFVTCVLEPQEELDARLIATGGGLREPICVARGFYRNPSDGAQEVTLRLTVSREYGAIAVLLAEGRQWEMWRFVLTEAVR
jgi:hypothetical protein